jgi:hypothetical protein
MESQYIGQPTVVNSAFVPLAIQAGLPAVIEGLVPVGLPFAVLLEQVTAVVQPNNPILAAALNNDTLKAVLDYMLLTGSVVRLGMMLPPMLNMDGPQFLASPYRDPNDAGQVNMSIGVPPEGFEVDIYLWETRKKTSNVAPLNGVLYESVSGVPIGTQVIRALYRRVSDGALSRFGADASVD